MALVFTNAGLAALTAAVAAVLASTSPVVPHAIGVGSGAGTAVATDTALRSAGNAPTSGTPTAQTTLSASDTYQLIVTVASFPTSPYTIREVGLFDATPTLWLHADVGPIVVNTGDTFTLTAKLQYM